jgi:hypothetical protein
MLDFHADKDIIAEIEMAPAGGDARGRRLDEVGVHWVQVLRRRHSDHQASFWIGKEEGVDGHEFGEAFCGVITDISRNSCLDKRNG